MKKNILPALCIMLMLASCTIQKRLYNTGFHLEWENAGYSANNPRETEHDDDTAPQAAFLPVAEPVSEEEKPPLAENNYISKPGSPALAQLDLIMPAGNAVLAAKPAEQAKDSSHRDEPVKKRMHPLAVLSFVLAILGFFVVILGPVVAVVLGFHARAEVLAQPEKYKGKGLATAAIVIGLVWLALTVAVITAALLA